MSKVYSDPTAALHGLLHDNMTIAAGGFELCGISESLIAALRDSGVDYEVTRQRGQVARAWLPRVAS